MTRIYLSVIFSAARPDRALTLEHALVEVARREFGVKSDGSGQTLGKDAERDVGFPVRKPRTLINRTLARMEARFREVAKPFGLKLTFERDARLPED